nr:MAG: capsid protein [Wufeng shrew circovirus 1]
MVRHTRHKRRRRMRRTRPRRTRRYRRRTYSLRRRRGFRNRNTQVLDFTRNVLVCFDPTQDAKPPGEKSPIKWSVWNVDHLNFKLQDFLPAEFKATSDFGLPWKYYKILKVRVSAKPWGYAAMDMPITFGSTALDLDGNDTGDTCGVSICKYDPKMQVYSDKYRKPGQNEPNYYWFTDPLENRSTVKGYKFSRGWVRVWRPKVNLKVMADGTGGETQMIKSGFIPTTIKGLQAEWHGLTHSQRQFPGGTMMNYKMTIKVQFKELNLPQDQAKKTIPPPSPMEEDSEDFQTPPLTSFDSLFETPQTPEGAE